MNKAVFMEKGRVVGNKQIARDIFELKLLPSILVKNLQPYQYVSLAPLADSSVMARPFSIFDVDERMNSFSILYNVVGKNTQLMSKLQIGDLIKFWGPLGGDPKIRQKRSYLEYWLVAGGIGIAPIYFWQTSLLETGMKMKLFYGSQTKNEIVNDVVAPVSRPEVFVTTDDGSFGCSGFVTDLFAHHLALEHNDHLLVITCGPMLMMKRVAELCISHNIDCRVILEKVMACGQGVCLGCSIKTTNGMKRVCHDGPVFDAKEVIWDELS